MIPVISSIVGRVLGLGQYPEGPQGTKHVPYMYRIAYYLQKPKPRKLYQLTSVIEI
jgi:hypothetical protein